MWLENIMHCTRCKTRQKGRQRRSKISGLSGWKHNKMKPGFKVKLPTMGILVLAVILLCPTTDGADLVIRIPSDLSHQDGFYRLDYRPPIGFPPANTTFRPTDIRHVYLVHFSSILFSFRSQATIEYSNGETCWFNAMIYYVGLFV